MNAPSSQAASPIRISLMCESPIVYKTLGPRLSADRSLQVVGWHDCLIELVPEVVALQPHVVILGISRITHFNMLILSLIHI